MIFCALEYADDIRRSNDRLEPGWSRDRVWCRLHQVYHELMPGPGQRSFIRSVEVDPRTLHSPKGRVRFLQGRLPCFHENAGTDVLTAPCAYCGTMLHAHRDELGRIKSGRLGKGFLEEHCPACHRANAVFPTYGDMAIRTTRVIDGKPAMQMQFHAGG